MTPEEFTNLTGMPFDATSQRCHAASVALVRSDFAEKSRVCRGACRGVPGQHSWVVLGDDCYATDAWVVDPTLWSYDSTVTGIWEGQAHERPHLPHGRGSIWKWGRPDEPQGEIIELEGEFSPEAQDFLDMLGPLDEEGWRIMAHAPVEDWPSGEIIAAMYRHPKIQPFIPIDIVGMVTDINPGGLYLKGEENESS